MKKFSEFVNEKKYKLIDNENKSLKSINYHGDIYEVKSVFKDEVLLIGPDGKEVMFDIDEIKSQDDMVKGIK